MPHPNYLPGEKVHPNLAKTAAGAAQVKANKLRSKKSNEMSKVGRVKTTPSPAGTNVESQMKYWSNPKNQEKLKSAMDKFHGKDKKSSKKNNTKVVKKNTNNNSSSNATTPKKSGTSAAELERQKKIIERKNPKLERLRKEMGMKTDKSSSTTTKTPDLVALGKAGKADAVKGKTRQEMRREARDDKKARRRAGRTAKQTLKTPGGSITDEQNNANIAAEKAKIQKRREGRNAFLRNFGSQITRGVQAPSREKFDDNQKGKDFYKNQMQKSAADVDKEASISLQKDALDGTFGSDTDYTNVGMKNNLFGNYNQQFGQVGNNPFTQSNSNKDRSSIAGNMKDQYFEGA